jgi:5-formyltetrahydrofolate cyclo-ligase
MSETPLLRQQLRQARRDLSPVERALATHRALQRLRRSPRFLRSRCIAMYSGVGGELCPMTLAHDAITHGKTVCLPVLHPVRHGHLLFCRWKPGDTMQTNRFGIDEPIPTSRNVVTTRQLDLVLVPLVGFDVTGNRIGMGGGFYDRTFAFRNRLSIWRRPFLLGIGFELQHVGAITRRPWDVSLDAAVTEFTYRSFTNFDRNR